MLTQEEYSEQLYTEDEILLQVKEAIIQAGMPQVSVEPGYGRLLTMLASVSRSKHILEIGALGGYSGICLSRGFTLGGSLTSLELRADYAELARRNLEMAGFGSSTEYRIGPAMDSLKALEAEGAKFDFFFIDADKENYPNYLDYAIKLANPGAIIAGDNIFLRGRTLNTERNGAAIQAVRHFNEMIATDERLISTCLPAYDGLALAIVK
jgi:caffeoyl-CoA O-methyltransferase